MKDPLEYSTEELEALSTEELTKLRDTTLDMVDKYNTEQLTKKILINALYGATGNAHFPLYNRDYASGITANGRIFIQQTANMLREKFQKLIPWNEEYWIYSDTDSVYYTVEPFVNKYLETHPNADTQELTDFCLKLAEKVVQPTIDESIDLIAERCNVQDKSRMGAKVEVVCDVMINCAKKKYFARVRDSEGVRYPPDDPHIKIMGLELAKSTTPKWVKDTISLAVPILFDKDEDTLKKWIDSVKDQYVKVSIADIAQIGRTNSLDYKLTDKAIPIGARVAIVYNNYIRTNNLEGRFSAVGPGDKFMYIRLVKNNPFNTDAIAFTSEKFANKYLAKYIDYDTMFEKTFLSALSLMCECMGYDVFKKTFTIEEW